MTLSGHTIKGLGRPSIFPLGPWNNTEWTFCERGLGRSPPATDQLTDTQYDPKGEQWALGKCCPTLVQQRSTGILTVLIQSWLTVRSLKGSFPRICVSIAALREIELSPWKHGMTKEGSWQVWLNVQFGLPLVFPSSLQFDQVISSTPAFMIMKLWIFHDHSFSSSMELTF